MSHNLEIWTPFTCLMDLNWAKIQPIKEKTSRKLNQTEITSWTRSEVLDNSTTKLWMQSLSRHLPLAEKIWFSTRYIRQNRKKNHRQVSTHGMEILIREIKSHTFTIQWEPCKLSRVSFQEPVDKASHRCLSLLKLTTQERRQISSMALKSLLKKFKTSLWPKTNRCRIFWSTTEDQSTKPSKSWKKTDYLNKHNP